MSKKRVFLGILFLCIGLGAFGIYIWGLLLAAAVEGMFSSTGVAATESTNLFALLVPLGATLSVAIALWLLLGPSTRRLFSSLRRGGRDR